MDVDIAEIVVTRCRELNSLTFHCTVDNKLGREWVLACCGSSLTQVHLTGKDVDDELLVLLAEVCALLQDVRLEGASMVTDIGVIALLADCPRLQNLSVLSVFGSSITVKSLQAVVDNKLRLIRLEVAFKRSSALKNQENWFREQLRNHQLLPVPELRFDEMVEYYCGI